MWTDRVVRMFPYILQAVWRTQLYNRQQERLLTPLRFSRFWSGNWWLEGPGHSAPVSLLLALGLLDGVALPGWLHGLPVAGFGLVIFAALLLGLHFLPVCLRGLLLTLTCRPLLLPRSLVSLLLPTVLRFCLRSAAWCLFLFLFFLFPALLLVVPFFDGFGAAKGLIFPFQNSLFKKKILLKI